MEFGPEVAASASCSLRGNIPVQKPKLKTVKGVEAEVIRTFQTPTVYKMSSTDAEK
jgi:hypothetical protein